MGEFLSLIKQFINQLICWKIVAPWEQAVRVRCGRYTTVLKGGIYFKIPVLDTYYVQSTRFRLSGQDKQTVGSLDKVAVTFSISIGYSIEDILKLYQTLHHAEDTIKNIVRSATSHYIATHAIADITQEKMTKDLNTSLDFSSNGLGNLQVFIADLVTVKAYRLIGDYMYGNHGDALSTAEVK